jgi:AmmeMemoRadiSam system protein B
MRALAQTVRPPAVAGRFYPADPFDLGQMVEEFLAQGHSGQSSNPKAVIAPHAGYSYSGPIAGSAFRSWLECAGDIRRVVLLGPSHFVEFPGLALPQAAGLATPLGKVRLDGDAVEQLRSLPQVCEFPRAHEPEHCLEVELPFLQRILPDFAIVPLVIGEATEEEVREVIDALWDGEETRFVLSSDLSHYHDYESAQRIDRATATAVEGGQTDRISSRQACGHLAICGFLKAAAPRALHAQTLDLRNSGDTAGPQDRVVGYGAFAFTPE